ncbi:MAG: hypothetical protein K1X51_18675 [Rhodospirillaceae bacterium]|nr:hypothetical protein [Rhodospirillaceae bacterium]
MKVIKTGLIAAALIASAAGLGACATYDDGYYGSSVSVGISSGPGYYGHRHWRDRDRDGDGIPNRFDSWPNNPYRP